MSAHTPRQEEAFSLYKQAVELYWLAKNRPVLTNEEAKARWAEIRSCKDAVDNAHDGLFASIVDEMP